MRRCPLLVASVLLLSLPFAAAATTADEETQALTPAPLEPQESTKQTRPKRQTEPYLMLDDARYLLTFPARPTRRGVILSSAFAAGFTGLVLLDQEIYESMRREEPLEDIKEIKHVGGFYETHLATLATYAGGRLAHHEATIETGKAMMEALLFTDLFVGVGKMTLGRGSPEHSRAGDWFRPGEGGRFPSGHTARAFTLATVLAERHGKVAAWIGYPLATLVGLSLIDSEDHWASDTVAAAALGYVVGRAVVRRREQRTGRGVRLEPVLLHQDGGVGMMLRITIPRKAARR